jgi:hypothetical protein
MATRHFPLNTVSSSTEAEQVKHIFQSFHEVSGAKLNYNKTMAIKIGNFTPPSWLQIKPEINSGYTFHRKPTKSSNQQLEYNHQQNQTTAMDAHEQIVKHHPENDFVQHFRIEQAVVHVSNISSK